jgi:hypothetical protein
MLSVLGFIIDPGITSNGKKVRIFLKPHQKYKKDIT